MPPNVCISIVIVNWNSVGFARECIRSIYEHTQGLAFEVIVVDNASSAADVDSLKDEFPGITLIKSSENLGFARANNLGARRSSGERLLFLNPDTIIEDAALRVMLEGLNSLPDAGIVGCRLLNGDRTVQTSCIQTFPTILNQVLDADALRKRWPSSRLWGTGPLADPQVGPAPVEVVSGACLMIKRDVFERIGMFSEDYFMYAEDLDLCYKAMRAGYRTYYVSEATVIHYGGGSSAPGPAAAMKWKSILRYCVKNRGPGYALAFRLAMIVAAAVRLALLAAAWPLSRGTAREAQSYSAAAKWRTILKTLLAMPGPTGVTANRTL